MDISHIRNFVIIAHIDHGKSTLADRFLEMTHTIDKRQMRDQVLDSLESERERGITIKMAPVRMCYKDVYTLNLIDTPGHSDFEYEVSRALAAVEGALLLVDATQGIQAQTLAHFETARAAGLTIIGVVSKVDLNPPGLGAVITTLADLLHCSPDDIIKVSGKTGYGVESVLDTIVRRVPPPLVPRSSHDRALVFDSIYDEHKGVIAFVRVFNGSFKSFEPIHFLATGAHCKIKELGFLRPKCVPDEVITTGMIGYIATGLKDPSVITIGDTISTTLSGVDPLTGYKKIQPVVFVSFYPEDSNEYEDLKQALAKLTLSDSSLSFEPESSELLGRGFKGGFLGQLHFEIIAERLNKEFHMATVQSFPSVSYEVVTKTGETIIVTNPKDFPADYEEAREPMVALEIITPSTYLGGVLGLNQYFRFSGVQTTNIGDRVLITASLPLADLISDLDDKLKSVSEGYASLSYELIGYETHSLDKLEILVAGHVIPGLTRILPRERIDREARRTVEKLKELLPRQQFMQAIQASVHGRIVARESIPAFRKDVTGYLYGGDRTRKMKLWKKQARGKARLKEYASQHQIQVPPAVFKELLKRS